MPDDGDLGREVMLQICGIAETDEEYSDDVGADLEAARALVCSVDASRNEQYDVVLVLVTGVLACFRKHISTHLPSGYNRPAAKSSGWVERETVETVVTQAMGLRWPNCPAQTLSFLVARGVDEARSLKFVQEDSYDAWRPGMASGSGWRSVLCATVYGLQKARAQARQLRPSEPPATPKPAVTQWPKHQQQPAPKPAAAGDASEGEVGAKAAGAKLHDGKVPEMAPEDAARQAAAPQAAQRASDDLLATGGAITDWLSTRIEQNDAAVIDSYSRAAPGDLLARCNQMIQCISWFATTFHMCPSRAASIARDLDEDWLTGFNRTGEILCLAAVARRIELGPFKELSSAAYSFWSGCLAAEPTGAELERLNSPCITALHELKRLLMLEMAETDRTKFGAEAVGAEAESLEPESQGEVEPQDTEKAGETRYPKLVFANMGEPYSIGGKEKPPLTEARYAVVQALLRAGQDGMKKDAIEAVRSSARKIITELRKDDDWKPILKMAEGTNGRYRILQ